MQAVGKAVAFHPQNCPASASVLQQVTIRLFCVPHAAPERARYGYLAHSSLRDPLQTLQLSRADALKDQE